jgi:hypothetical protein
MIIALVLSFIAIASGTLLTYTYDEDAPLAARLCSGACIGFALLGLIGFGLALLIGLTPVTLIATAMLLAAPFLLLGNAVRRDEISADINDAIHGISRASLRPNRWDFIYFSFYVAVAIGMWLVFDRALVEKPDGIYTGVLNNYGDLPFHLSVITRFAFGQNYPPEDPTFAGVRFTYPFITDFISAMFVRAGASLRESMFVENWILGVALVGVLHRFGQQLLRQRLAAILTPLLIIFNGGFGWAMLFDDVRKIDGGVFQVLTHIQHSYTILPEVAAGWRWGNSVTSLLVPQRGFLLGIPLAVIVFTQWWTAASPRNAEGKEQAKSKTVKGKKEERREKKLEATAKVSGGPGLTVATPSLFTFSFLLLPSSKRMLAAGIVAGLLPLVHAHSFIAVMLVGACLAIVNWTRWREWLWFFLVASIIAVPQLLWSTHGSAVHARAFLALEFGWDKGTENFFWFWLKNTGLFIPLLVAALLWKRENYLVSRRLLFFYLPFLLCFIIPNLVKLAPGSGTT